jgi:AraC-like DNA-binding protein
VLNGREALRLAREIIDAAGPVVTLPPGIIDRLALACHTLIDRPAISPGEASSAAYGAMTALHDGVFGTDAAPNFTLPPAIARVVAYIDTNLNRALNIDRLATLAEMSRSHFVRQFTLATGLAPSSFVQERRIERIERLLVATDMTIGAIAALTGFSDANYLAKAFRRLRGMTPLDYRVSRRMPTGI